ncbi:MAG: tRNA (adenosine(37)-N6)-dimethylallyltransferase MiaA [Pseudomonadota bacterium]
MTNNKAILIAGPTACGKSKLAIELAKKIDGVVINADSMQVYQDLNILTARPQLADLAIAPHRLYGFVPGEETYSVGRFVEDAGAIIAECNETRQIPILVGGTGLYFKALLDGLSPIPPIPPAVRAHWRAEADRIGSQKLYDVLSERDPEMAERLKPSDPQRIVRALEVLDGTSQSLAYWQSIPGVPTIESEAAIGIVVDPQRETVCRNSDLRLEWMVANGALAEVATLMAKQLDPAAPIMRALGVQPLMAHLQNELSLDEAIAATKVETRHYIKRQLTWFKRNMISWKWLNEQQIESFKENILQIIE